MSEKSQQDERETAALRHLLAEIDGKYATRWFVAIDDEREIAASADFHDLEDALIGQGRDPRNTMVVQAGVGGPEYATIFL